MVYVGNLTIATLGINPELIVLIDLTIKFK